jgi:hypothetical protein
LRFKGLKWPLRLVLSIAVCISVLGADKGTFQAKPVSSYSNKQTSEGITIAASTFITDEQAKEAFGKLNPWRYNILPVLVVIQNSSPSALDVSKMHLQYELPDRSKVDATSAADVKYSQGPNRPKIYMGPVGAVKVGKIKSPLNVPEIEIRAFAAKMIPPGETASGFVYFETDITSAGASLYVSGLLNPTTGKELYYFEIPLSDK